MHITEIAKLPTPGPGAAISEPLKKAWDRLLTLKTSA
jgi:hypothetical protein